MSIRLSLTPSWFIQIPWTNESVSIGVFTTLFPLVGNLTVLNLKLVLLEYCSCSSCLFSRLPILFFIELIWSFCFLFWISWRINASLLCWMVSRWGYLYSSTILAILGLISSMTFSLIKGIIESINSWFLRVAQQTSDRCRMFSLWIAVERACSVLTVLEVTDSLICRSTGNNSGSHYYRSQLRKQTMESDLGYILPPFLKRVNQKQKASLVYQDVP